MKSLFSVIYTASATRFKMPSALAAVLALALSAHAQGTAPAAEQTQSTTAATTQAETTTPRQATAPTQTATTAPAAVRSLAVAPVDVSTPLAAALQSPAEQESLKLFTDLVHKELVAALSRTGTFQIVQRQDLSKILAEQDLGQSGNVNPQTAARIGELIGAQVLGTVDLLQFDYLQRQTRSTAINRDIVTVSLNTRARLNLLDTTTGALLASVPAEGNAVETQQYFVGSYQQGNFSRVPVTEAARLLADDLAKAVNVQLFPARVLAVTGRQVTLNRGSDFFKNGDIVDIIQYGAELRDPDTGRSLGREEVLIGQGKVVRATAQTTTVSITEDNGVQTGQVALKQQP